MYNIYINGKKVATTDTFQSLSNLVASYLRLMAMNDIPYSQIRIETPNGKFFVITETSTQERFEIYANALLYSDMDLESTTLNNPQEV